MSGGMEVALPVSLQLDLKHFLRIEHDADDVALVGFLRAAIGMCENFIGQILVERQLAAIVKPLSDWQRLQAEPVRSIDSVETIGEDSQLTPVAVDRYAIEIDGRGRGWIRATGSTDERWRVGYCAGLAPEWNAVPEALRHGIVRLAAHFYNHRDSTANPAPPLAVSALWRPWRQVRL